MEGKKHTYHLPHTEELQKKVLKLEEKPIKGAAGADKHSEESNPEEIAREEEDKEELMENPASLYGSLRAPDPYGPGHSAMHHEAHQQHHPGVHPRPLHDAPHHHFEVTAKQASYGSAKEEAENEYMSTGRERKNSSSSGKGPDWIHPEKLSAEERD